MNLLIGFLFFGFVQCGPFDHFRLQSSSQIEEDTVYKMIKRLLPESGNQFVIHVNHSLFALYNKDMFIVKKSNTDFLVNIQASSGVAAAWGLNFYLKEICKIHINWDTTILPQLESLPDANITIIANDLFRYYQNVCTSSYTYVWWTWEDWSRHIDWMALNGINLPLAFTGQEAIWDRVYRQVLNITDAEINEHFTGPAFLAWNRMGNLRGWGGPLTQQWHTQSIELQKKILERMRNFGMYPVLPGFAGHVPRAIKRIYPNAKVTLAQKWNSFQDKYCCPYLLDPSDPMFKALTKVYINELVSEFGTNHAYNFDPFNEMDPEDMDEKYLASYSRQIFEAIDETVPKAIWIIQNWFMVHSAPVWTLPRIKAFFSGIPIGRLIILDLMSEQHPQYQRTQNYFGHYFIWNMLHNFGGTLGLFGSMDIINKEIFKARNGKNAKMIGSGLTPEGINQNYVMYEFMSDMFLQPKSVDLNKWINSYIGRRYGKQEVHSQNAWKILQSTIYNYTGSVTLHGKFVINRRPRTNYKPWYWFEVCDFLHAWDEIILASNSLNKPGFLYDLVDITRQTLQTFGDQYYNELITAFKSKDLERFQNAKDLFLDVFNDMDRILQTNEGFLLGNWLNSAKSFSSSEAYPGQFEFNARNQITLWGPNGEIKDYANKQWAGVVIDFFKPRWELFINEMYDSLKTGIRFNEKAVQNRILNEVETPFTHSNKNYSIKSIGDTVKIANEIHKKWFITFKRTHKHCYEFQDLKNNGSEDDLTGYDNESESRLTTNEVQQYISTPNIVIT